MSELDYKFTLNLLNTVAEVLQNEANEQDEMKLRIIGNDLEDLTIRLSDYMEGMKNND